MSEVCRVLHGSLLLPIHDTAALAQACVLNDRTAAPPPYIRSPKHTRRLEIYHVRPTGHALVILADQCAVPMLLCPSLPYLSYLTDARVVMHT